MGGGAGGVVSTAGQQKGQASGENESAEGSAREVKGVRRIRVLLLSHSGDVLQMGVF